MTEIHSTAIVHDDAVLGDNVTVGPYCIVGPRVQLADNVTLEAHIVIRGNTQVGAGCHIYPFASIGSPPQHLQYKGEDNRLVIGANTTIREHATLNPGAIGDDRLTEVGSDCLIMIGAHVAHDCRLGRGVILINNVQLGGHVEIADHAIVGGASAVHQFVRIGAHSFVGGMSAVNSDVIPFGSVLGNRAHLGGLNLVGMKRHGFNREQIHTLRQAYRLLFSDEGTLKERVEDVAQSFPDEPLVQQIVSFISLDADRAICTPR